MTVPGSCTLSAKPMWSRNCSGGPTRSTLGLQSGYSATLRRVRWIRGICMSTLMLASTLKARCVAWIHSRTCTTDGNGVIKLHSEAHQCSGPFLIEVPDGQNAMQS